MYKICVLVLYLSSICETKNILGVFPTPSISHQKVFRSLVQALVKRGHEVTIITTDPEYFKGESPQNLTEIDVHDISYNIWKQFVEGTDKGTADSLVEQIKMGYSLLSQIFEAQVKTPEVQKLLSNKEKKFDLIIMEHCVRLALSFSYVYDAPVIEISSMGGLVGTFEAVGAASHPLIYPLSFLKGFHNFNIWDKISQINVYNTFNRFYKTLEISDNMILKNLFGPNIPDLADLKKNSHMLFLNVHPIWDLNRPVPPNVVYLGGIHQKQPKDLPKVLYIL